MNKANINHSLLKWARESCGFSIDHVAKKLRVEVDTIPLWESGKSTPDNRVILELAALYQEPFTFFYLDRLPEELRRANIINVRKT